MATAFLLAAFDAVVMRTDRLQIKSKPAATMAQQESDSIDGNLKRIGGIQLSDLAALIPV